MELSDPNKVWNRAALESGGKAGLQGDRALSALLAVHGMIMNGGVYHALEALSAAEFADGIAGFRYFGLCEVANVLDAASIADMGWDLFDAKYGTLIPDDGVLSQAFEQKYTAFPNAFAPLERATPD